MSARAKVLGARVLRFSSIAMAIALPLIFTCSAEAQDKPPTGDVRARAEADSLLTDVDERIATIERFMQTGLSENLISPRNVIGLATIIISAVAVVVVLGNAIIVVQGRFLLRDVKEQYARDIDAFREAERVSRMTLAEVQNKIDSLRDTGKATEDMLHGLRESARAEAASITDQAGRSLESLRNAMMETMNVVLEGLHEMAHDQETSRRLEVIRSKNFVYLGDLQEKVRSLQYIGQLGREDDIGFLEMISGTEGQPGIARVVAERAKAMIRERTSRAETGS